MNTYGDVHNVVVNVQLYPQGNSPPYRLYRRLCGHLV
jgi:hypothetical protein